MQPLNTQFDPSSSYFFRFRNKYKPQPVFVPFCDRPRFTPTKNNVQNYRSDKSCCKPMVQTDDDFSEHELRGQDRHLPERKRDKYQYFKKNGEEIMYPKKSVYETANDFVTNPVSFFLYLFISYSDLCLPIHYRCRELLLHLITLSDTHKHKHHTNTPTHTQTPHTSHTHTHTHTDTHTR